MTPGIAIVGPSGSGKTTLITKLIKILTARGYRVGAIKHTHHDFEIDYPGKDSFAFKAAGASAVALVAPHKLAIVSECASEPSVEGLISRYFDDVQLVLVEGFKHSALPKILVEEGVAKISQRRFGPEEIERLADLLEEQFLR
ncbi:MAG: molybdopterin-guanine dinucleotide biosynthesis protein B [Candidatus Bipolaricaulota bacterium]|nr:molybdopterin-guanine dinucleotide biosynthesis protein B [Candidatus Bipolaricaulota bacterium]